MKKKEMLLKCSGLGLAISVFSLCLTSCLPGNKSGEKAGSEIDTEEVSWVENDTEEGCKLSADYPTGGTGTVNQNIREWINEELGGTYNGDLKDGRKVLEFYGKAYVEQVKKNIAEIGENTALEHYTYIVEFDKAFETDAFVTYTSEVYEYAGGAHGSTMKGGEIFRKEDDRKIGWDMFTTEGKEALRNMLKDGLMKDYFEVKDEEEFYNMLLVDNARYAFPLPETAPIFMSDGVQFIYQQYEIAPYASGIPACTLSYESLKDLFTTTMKPLIESAIQAQLAQ